MPKISGVNGNSFVIESGSDVNAVAGNSITFLPGFEVKRGATFHASIAPIDYGTTLRVASIAPHKATNYSKPSPYMGKIYNYKERDIPKLT